MTLDLPYDANTQLLVLSQEGRQRGIHVHIHDCQLSLIHLRMVFALMNNTIMAAEPTLGALSVAVMHGALEVRLLVCFVNTLVEFCIRIEGKASCRPRSARCSVDVARGAPTIVVEAEDRM